MSDELESRVCDLVAQVFNMPRSEVSLATSQDTTASWDSINIINLMIALEEEFGVHFSEDEATQLLSVQLTLMLLREKGVA
jgi:acyl carrier protein